MSDILMDSFSMSLLTFPFYALLVVFISPLTPPPYFPFIERFNRPFRGEDSPVISLSGCHSSLSGSTSLICSTYPCLPSQWVPSLCPSPSRPLNSSQFTSLRTLTTFHLPFSFTFYSGSHFLCRVLSDFESVLDRSILIIYRTTMHEGPGPSKDPDHSPGRRRIRPNRSMGTIIFISVVFAMIASVSSIRWALTICRICWNSEWTVSIFSAKIFLGRIVEHT